MGKNSRVLLVATMDTKAEEALYVEAVLKGQGLPVLIMDPGIMGDVPHAVAVTREEVVRAAGSSLTEVRAIGHEGKALDVMISGAVRCALSLHHNGEIHGIIALGGSMGTTLGTAVMRAFPVGFPKVMISTMASRDTRHFVGTRDILMLYAVCDINGLNRVTKKVLRNGALAVAGMVQGGPSEVEDKKPLAALSTLGTIEDCSRPVKQALETRGYEVVVFHGVGAGGAAMEEMIREEEVDAVVDLSLHEIADRLFGGDYDAGPDRGRGSLQKGIPTLLVPGNIDFLAAGPMAEAERRFPGRRCHQHNAAITCVRSERHEIDAVGRVLAGYCNECRGPVSLLVPLKGFSALDRKNGPLHDPEGPPLFEKTFRRALKKEIPVEGLPLHINDEAFARAVIGRFDEMMAERRS